VIGKNSKKFAAKLNVFAVSLAISLASAVVPMTAAPALAAPCPTGFTFTAPNCQRSFEYTGAMQTFSVPNGVDLVTAYVIGARGGLSYPAPPATGAINNEGQKRSTGNSGAIVLAAIPVTVGQQLNLFVGGAGQAISGGWNGGGKGAARISGPRQTYESTSRNPNAASGEKGGGGGGASDIRVGGTGLANRQVVAGGGGGTGFGNAGITTWYMGGDANGWAAGQSAGNNGISQAAGKGGGQTAGGAGGALPTAPWQGFCVGPNTSAGTAGQGGYAGGNYTPDPNSPNIEYCSGGGGGGGYFGGGGGMVAGGGAGANYMTPAWSPANNPNFVTANNPPTGNSNIEGMTPNGNGRIILVYRATTVISVAPVTPVSTSTTHDFDVTFAQPVSGFDVNDFSVKNTSTATGGSWTKTMVSTTDATHYRIRVANSAATDGTVIANVNATGVTVIDGNSPGIGDLDGTATIDRIGPLPTSVTFNPSIIKASPVTVTAVFNEKISNLDATKVTIGGTSTGWSKGAISGSGTTTLTFALTKSGALTSGQTLTVDLDAALGIDSVGNTSSASTTATANIDNTPPTATIAHTMGSLTSLASMPYTVTFNKDVRWIKASNVASPSFSVTGTATGCVATPDSPATVNRAVTVNVTGCSNGTVILNLLANSVEDLAGNTSAFGVGNAGPAALVAASSVTRDGTPPSVTTFSQLTTTRNANTIRYSVTFSESVINFTPANISVTGASGSVGTWAKALVSGSGAGPYVFEVANSSANHGDVSVRVAAGVATDAALNPNVASNALSTALFVMPSVTLGTPAQLSKSAAVALVPSAIITDRGTGLFGLRVKITTSTLKTGDTLSFASSAATGSIAAAGYANGTLDLSSNSATPAQWQAALRAVKINTTSTVTTARSFEVILKPFKGFSYESQHVFVNYPQSGNHTTWTTAKAAAEATYLGTMPGYLPTIYSEDENNAAVAAALNSNGAGQKFWLGASDAASNYTWKWVTGPEAGEQFCFEDWFWHGCNATSSRYNNWQAASLFNGVKPNNGSNYGAMLTSGVWDDAPHDWNILGGNVTNLVVEFGSQRIGDPSYNVAASGVSSVDTTGPVVQLTSDGGLIGGKLNYTLTGDEEILCTTLTSSDFTATNMTITSVTQSGPKQCSIVGAPNISAGSTGSVGIAKSGTFSVSDLGNNASISMASPTGSTALTQSVTVPAVTALTLPNDYLAVAPTTGFTATDPATQAANQTALVNAKIVDAPAGAPTLSVLRDISDRPTSDIVKLTDIITVPAGTEVDASLKANPARQSTSQAWAFLKLKNGNWLALGKRALDSNGLAKVEPMAFTDPGTYIIKIIIADEGTIMPSSFRRSGLRTAAITSDTQLTDIGTQSYDLTVVVTGTAPVVSNPIPVVSSVTSSTTNGTLTTGSVVSVQVTFDSAVNVAGGVPTLALNVGASPGYATYASGSGSSVLTFNYTVRAGDSASDLDYASTTALALGGATIVSSIATNNSAILTLPAPGAAGSLSTSKALVVDSAPPVITFAASSATSTNTTVRYVLLGNEPIDCSTLSNVNGVDFDFTNVASLTIAQTDPTTCTLTAVSTATLGTMASTKLAKAATFSVADANGVTSSALSPSTAETLVNNGSTQAAVTNVTSTTSGTFGAGNTIQVQVNFDAPVTVSTAGGAPTLNLNFGGVSETATYTSGSGTSSLTFSYLIQSGDATANLDYAGANALSIPAGSSISSTGGSAYTVLPTPGSNGSLSTTANISTDTTAPAVSLSASAPTATTTVVNFDLTSDEAISCASLSAVNGVDFTFSNASSIAVTQVDSMTCRIAATTSVAIGASGTTTLSAASTFNLTDVSGNAATYASLTTTDASIVVTPQAIVPTIPSVSSVAASTATGVLGVGDSVNIQVHFDTLVQVTGTPQLVLNFGSGANKADYAYGSGTDTLTFTYFVQAGDTIENLDLASANALILNGGSLTNPTTHEVAILTVPVGVNAHSLASNSSVAIDTVEPTVILASSSTSSSSRQLTFTLTGDEALNCQSLSIVDGVDFVFTNLSSISISQASSRVCQIQATSSLADSASGSSGLVAAQTFAISDAHGLTSSALASSTVTVAMSPVPSGGSGSSSGGSTSTTMPTVPSLPKESKALATSGGDSLALDGEHLDGVTRVTAIQNGKEVVVEIISSTATRLVIKTPALLAGSADLIIETLKGSVIFKNALVYVVTIGGGTKPLVTSKSFVISGFAAGKSSLSAAMKAAINKYVVANKAFRTITCVGYTMGPTRRASDVLLSKARAQVACNYAVIRNKSLKVAKVAGVRETKLGAQIRRISLSFTK
jgi:large repetitive protein